jgi:hypothetical protein
MAQDSGRRLGDHLAEQPEPAFHAADSCIAAEMFGFRCSMSIVGFSPPYPQGYDAINPF